MKKRYLTNCRQIELEDHNELLLEYYMVKEEKECGPVYGIEITGYRGGECTREYTGAISEDVGFVRRLLEKLYLGAVTPVTLAAQVDQLLELYV